MKQLTLTSIVILSLISLNLSAGYSNECAIRGEVYYSGDQVGAVIVAAFNFQLDFESFDFNFEESFLFDTLESPGAYEFDSLDAGTYLIAAFMDVNKDGLPGFIEPLGAYPDRVEISDSSIVNDVDIYLNDLSRGNSSISGTIHYNGQLQGKIHVFAIGATGTPFNFNCPTIGDSTYTISGLMAGEYFVVAFLDVDDNGQPDIGEPVGFIQDKIEVGDSDNITGKDLTLFVPGDFSGSISGSINYNGSDSGTVYIYTIGLTNTPITITELNFPENSFYEVLNLDQGAYYMFAFLDTNNNEEFDPMELKLEPLPNVKAGEPYELIADSIVLTEDDHKQLDLILEENGDAGISGNITYDGDQKGLVLVLAVGLSPSWLGINIAELESPNDYSYLIYNLDAGLYAVIGLMITNLTELKFDLNTPIGFYTKNLVCVTAHDTVPDIDFILQDSTTATSKISGTITTSPGVEGEIHLFSAGISLTYWPEVIITENTYTIPDLRMGRYMVGGFIDVNGNGVFDLKEPFAYTESLVEIPQGDMEVVVDLVFETELWVDVDNTAQNLPPDQFVLAENYPNPFNPTTNIQYQLVEPRMVSIKVYNLLGNEVKTLVNKKQSTGSYQITWDGTNNNGEDVSSGVYLYCMKAGDFVGLKKMTLIR